MKFIIMGTVYSILFTIHAHAAASVKFECSDAMLRSDKSPVIRGVGPQNFMLSCIPNGMPAVQEVNVPAGNYTISCSLNHGGNQLSIAKTLDDNKTYIVKFIPKITGAPLL